MPRDLAENNKLRDTNVCIARNFIGCRLVCFVGVIDKSVVEVSDTDSESESVSEGKFKGGA